ncbi:hypothetical protein VTN77DRAFT_6979 [Rasamsonia byssochlamydoides]|uniref:uncharacterized protein n=1 Tax=Rasamsonia byssochlamydoides TaxID=89139 RepID=UPI0037425439
MEWDPTQFFRSDKDRPPRLPYAILVLNQPINERAFVAIRKHACFILCADGGANRYYDLMKSRGKVDTDLPSAIVGDLDSLLPHVRQHYTDRGVPILHDPDQYSTDFTKCLKYLRANAAEIVTKSRLHPQSDDVSLKDEQQQQRQDVCLDVLILGGLGGRVDQAFSQIHHLYAMTRQSQQHQEAERGDVESRPEESKEKKTKKREDLYLISEESISFVLQPGQNTILTPGTNRPGVAVPPPSGTPPPPLPSHQALPEEESTTTENKPCDYDDYYLEENVGIIPLNGPSVITLRGFEWDVTDWRTEIGGQISTSNHIRADVVQVETDRPVLFTVELASRFKVGGRAR